MTRVILPPDPGKPNPEALKLYRDILRACRAFRWKTQDGEEWGVVLARSARAEFEDARYERDPAIVAELLANGRVALETVQEKYLEKQASFVNDVDQSRTDRR